LTENYYCGYPLKQPNTTIIFASGIVSEKRWKMSYASNWYSGYSHNQ
jgi:hypothetical protein